MKSKAGIASASLAALLVMAPAAHAQVQPQGKAEPADDQQAQANAGQAQAAQDQAADETSSPGLKDIVVTATRQSTNLQSTPIAITAVTSQQLEDRGLKSTADLSAIVPNATFRRAQGAYGPGVTAFIRGIGQSDTSLGSEPAVAYYVDDVYYPLLLGSNFDLLDLDHIEVLRGPQGTLFGRNALAGAVNIVSKQPSLTETSAFAQATLGSYNRMDFRAGFNIPLTDTLALQVGGLSKKRDGFQRVLDFRCEMIRQGTPQLAGSLPFSDSLQVPASNYSPKDCTIGHLGGEDVRAIKGTLLFKPRSNIKLTVSGDYTRDNSENPADQLLVVTGPGNINVQQEAAYFGVAYDQRFVTGNPFTTYATYADPVGSGVVIPGSTFYNGLPQRGGSRFDPVSHLDQWGVSGKLVIGLTDNIDLTTIVGYRDMTERHSFDVDGSPIALEHTLLNIGEHYTNVETRLSGKTSWLDWVVGGFYFEGQGFTHAITYSPQSAFFKIQNITYKPISKAAFANVTIKPLNRLSIVLGGRYSDDSKGVDFSNVLDTNAGTDSHVGDTLFNIRPNATRFDWKAGVNYQVTDAILGYFSAATGARLPGYNTRPQQPSQVSSYAGDETLAYELGVKADFFDHRLRVNADAFYTDYKTRITSVTGAEPNLLTGEAVAGTQTVIPLAAGGPGATSCRNYNAATDGPTNIANGVGVACIPRTYFVNTPGKVKGFEIEIQANPIRGLEFNGSVGYANFSSPDLDNPARANHVLSGVPEINANAGVQYTVDVDKLAGTITPRLDWNYTGPIDPSAAQNTYNQPGYSLVNGRITYANEEHKFTLSFSVSNIFDERYYQNFFVYQDIGFPNNNAQPGTPREWAIEIGKKF